MSDQVFIVVQECSTGNEQVGDMWLETRTFSPTATLAEVWAWRNKLAGNGGKLIVTEENVH